MFRRIVSFTAALAWLAAPPSPVIGQSTRDGVPPAASLPPALAPDGESPMATELDGAAPGGVTAPPGPSLEDFERWAIARNPTLQQAGAQIEAARSRSYQAGLYPNPRLGYVAEQIGTPSEVSGSGTFGRSRSPGELQGGFVEQEIVTGGKLRLSREKFAEEATAARFQADAQRLRVLNGVRTRYFEVLAAQRLVGIHGELVRINADAVGTTEQLVNVGQANVPDLLQARLEARRAGVALEEALKRHRGDWEALTSVAGAPGMPVTWLDTRELDAERPPRDFESTLAWLLRCSPEILAALAEIRRDQVMVRRERAEPIPNVTVQAVVGRNYEFNITTAGVQVGIPLPVWNRNQGTVREAMADLARSRAEYERIALSLRERLADAFARYEGASWSVREFNATDTLRAGGRPGPEAGSLQLARQAYEVQLASFRARRAAWPQVLVAQRTYYELLQEDVRSRLEQRRVEVEINGMLLVDGLSPPTPPTSQGHIESVPQPR